MSLIAFLLLSAAVASTGILFKPGSWYRGLKKPGWTPPNLAFPIVWSILYVLIAISGWLVWRQIGPGWPFLVFGAQLLANLLWSWLFFGKHRPDLAFGDIVALWLLVAANIAVFAPVSTFAAWLLVPYLVWVSVALVLNLSVWRLNRDRGVFA
ncbi:TspO/MBR family protein [Aureimonas sp. AU4]|uniref:TspO/MBR family protein n=1 Tax=Aureimonas sp. AU4 TaxID=1638163 RepID=UPI000781C641|nr:TspO/MBR family protein [Aureimonas sp. AU4]